MYGLKWLKLSLDIFENRKIKYILTLDFGAEYSLIWIKLLCLAGKIGDGGEIYIVKSKPYKTRMLAASLGVSEERLTEAIALFDELSMIEYLPCGVMRVKNFTAYQEGGKPCGMNSQLKRDEQTYGRIDAKTDDKTDEQTDDKTDEKAAEQKYERREEEIREEEIREEKNRKEKNINTLSHAFDAEKRKYGRFSNVLLTEKEYGELKLTHNDIADRLIEELSLYLESRGECYSNHFAVLLRWAGNEYSDKLRQRISVSLPPSQSGASSLGANSFNNRAQASDRIDIRGKGKAPPGYNAPDSEYVSRKSCAPKRRYGDFDAEEAFRLAVENSFADLDP